MRPLPPGCPRPSRPALHGRSRPAAHTGYIHRWAARHMTGRSGRGHRRAAGGGNPGGGAADEDLLDWFRTGTPRSSTPWPRPTRPWRVPGPCPPRPRWPSGRGARPTRPPSTVATRNSRPRGAEVPGRNRRRRHRRADRRVASAKYQPQVVPAAGGGLLGVVRGRPGDAWSIAAREGRLQPRRQPRPRAAQAASAANGPAWVCTCSCRTALTPSEADTTTVTGDPNLWVLAGQRQSAGADRPAASLGHQFRGCRSAAGCWTNVCSSVR